MEFNIVEKLLAITSLGSEWVLWLLLALSVTSLGVIVERLIYYARIRLDFVHFSREVTRRLLEDDIDGIKGMCSTSASIESQTILRGLEYREKGVGAMEQSMTGFLFGEKQKLDHGLVILGTLGSNAPFIGLFGTVIGIIQAFDNLASNPAGGPSVVMAGISEALIATAVGLMVAIPAVIAFNGFQRVVRRKLSNAEAMKSLVVAHFNK
ncbi:MAG TPA: MotA/TolQ/ExbB proton channel family protein [Oligoflexus sp.]|uniref:MotA/TolQ/ExbB proton channel family protein n=1 Tax=Oligoflexus sp. TaxID=1971216 RepID=UPI002D4465BA|nr:MotA/TolQ/ExbB proton channel family protein [Oligoflexus sp.]HYX39068.1 MotA/TolQ/ExbB proton channel family protein [Oligoflexus sp.]